MWLSTCPCGTIEHPLYIPKSGIIGSWGRLFPNFLRNCHTDIQRGYTSFHSHQQCRSVPFTPQPLQHKLSSVFLILAILTGVRWNLRVVLICIFLITKDLEHVLMCLSAIIDSSVESSLFRSVLHFFNWIMWSFSFQFLEFFVYFGDQTSVCCGVSEDLFPFCRLSFFFLLTMSFALQKVFSFRRSHLLIVSLSVCAAGVLFRKWFPVSMSSSVLPISLLKGSVWLALC